MEPFLLSRALLSLITHPSRPPTHAPTHNTSRPTHKYPDSLNLMVIWAAGILFAPNDFALHTWSFPRWIVFTLWGPICGSFHSANIYRAPTVCRAQMDVGAKGNYPGGREMQEFHAALCFLATRWGWGEGRGDREGEGRPYLNGETISFFHPHFLLPPSFFFSIHILSLSLHLSCLSHSLLSLLPLSLFSTKTEPPQSFHQTWELSLCFSPL